MRKILRKSVGLTAFAILALASTVAFGQQHRVVIGIGMSGDSSEESRTDEPGDSGTWDTFAAERGLSAPSDWADGFDWQSSGLDCIPSAGALGCEGSSENYPARHVGTINLTDNSLTDFGGLYPIETIGALNLAGNQATSADGLDNLREVSGTFALADGPVEDVSALSSLEKTGHFYLRGTDITSLSGLENLSEANSLKLNLNPHLADVNALGSGISLWLGIRLHDNPSLVDISGLEGVIEFTNSNALVYLDPGIHQRSGFVPIPGDAWLCQASQASFFEDGYAQQDEVCE